MTIRTLKKEHSEKHLRKFIESPKDFFENLSNDYIKIRNELKDLYLNSCEFRDSGKLNQYQTDLSFALKIYKYFNDYSWFDVTRASDYGFWRYICVQVVPDIIQDRHGINDYSYYYSKNVRIYLPAMWWYIHMSYQGDINKTKVTLSGLNTDYILQLVERPGKDGLYVSISRLIMYYIGILPKNILENKIDNKNLLRRVLIQNTSRMNNYNLIFDHNEDFYVQTLFLKCGVKVKDYE
ncbi:hypothetical protein KHQ89_04065 [Mycoplasmatota bacterium]|nr:hypothetical protein KHQ89_04065 [Mycoplasmatota bacterium]